MGVDVHLADVQSCNILMWEASNLHSRRSDLSVGAFYTDLKIPKAKETQTKGDMSLKCLCCSSVYRILTLFRTIDKKMHRCCAIVLCYCTSLTVG